jgi:hypothetical protein
VPQLPQPAANGLRHLIPRNANQGKDSLQLPQVPQLPQPFHEVKFETFFLGQTIGKTGTEGLVSRLWNTPKGCGSCGTCGSWNEFQSPTNGALKPVNWS